jgi:AraC family transcriptional regulator, regulatory protein of adaptative response / DNA-3-methyladenine glycosylase II
MIDFLAARAVAGLEEIDGSVYRRSLSLRHGAAVAAMDASGRDPRVGLQVENEHDRADAVARCRRLLDLDADMSRIDFELAGDPLLGPLVRRRPGVRVPRSTDGFELAVRAVIGQQVTLAAARRVGERLVAKYGRRLERPMGSITHLFPEPEAIASVDSVELQVPRARAGALRGMAQAVLDGSLDLSPETDRPAAIRTLLTVPGIGPWTASYIGMRALGDDDAFPPGDAAVRSALERLGQDGRPAAVRQLAERWRPWRSYALMHLWRVASRRAASK